MTANLPLAAPWLVRAYHELQRGRHLVVHGDVDDLIRWGNEYYGLSDVLGEFMAVNRFPIVARLSRVDGLTYRDDEAADLARRLDGRANSAPAAGPTVAPPPSTPAMTPRAQTHAQSRQDLEQRMRANPRSQQRSLSEALASIRRLLVQDQTAAAVVIDSADLIVGTEGQLDESYPGTVADLRRLLEEAGDATDATGARRHNSLVFVCRDLGTLPAWLRENSTVATVRADRPGPEERADLIRRQLPRFHNALPGASEPQLDQDAKRFVRLTDGMTVRDLQSLEVTSRITGIGADAPKRLVSRHRFGLREDPWEQLDPTKVRDSEALLGLRVMGQPLAVRAVSDVLVNAKVGIDFVPADLDSSSRPRGVFFFVGPTGVGKTELAKALAQLVFDDENAMKRFDMSEYGQEHASERLTGSPPGFVGHEQGGALTNWVLERPFSVILFDEIEKANGKIFDKFLQIIDDGRLTDGQGRTAYFSHSIVIFTSNKGSASMRDLGVTGPPSYEDIRAHFDTKVREFFTDELRRPELLGRLGGGIVVFDMLREPTIRAITGKFLDEITRSAAAKGYDLVLDRDEIESAVVLSVMGSGAELGARQIRDPLLEQWVRGPVNRWIIDHSPEPGTRITVARTTGDPPFAVVGHPRVAIEAG